MFPMNNYAAQMPAFPGVGMAAQPGYGPRMRQPQPQSPLSFFGGRLGVPPNQLPGGYMPIGGMQAMQRPQPQPQPQMGGLPPGLAQALGQSAAQFGQGMVGGGNPMQNPMARTPPAMGMPQGLPPGLAAALGQGAAQMGAGMMGGGGGPPAQPQGMSPMFQQMQAMSGGAAGPMGMGGGGSQAGWGQQGMGRLMDQFQGQDRRQRHPQGLGGSMGAGAMKLASRMGGMR